MTQRVLLETPTEVRAEEFLRLVAVSQRFHSPWVSPPSTPGEYDAYLRRCGTETFQGYFVCGRSGGELAGVINFSEIVRGCFQNAYLGFYAFAPAAGQGLMRAGIEQALDLAFTELALHRVEANVQPDNMRSMSLIGSLGFSKEGFSRNYLKIEGEWRDHVRWALLAEDWNASRSQV